MEIETINTETKTVYEKLDDVPPETLVTDLNGAVILKDDEGGCILFTNQGRSIRMHTEGLRPFTLFTGKLVLSND